MGKGEGTQVAGSRQILVVDDHYEMLALLRSMLEMSGEPYQVTAVPSAEEGLLAMSRRPFDLLITDVRLPGMSGFELVRQTKSRRDELPVIMMTAYKSAQGRQEAKELGVFRYFEKPLDSRALLSAVHLALTGEPAATLEDGDTDRNYAAEPARSRVRALRADTGAAHVVLADARGEILHEAGSGPRQLDVADLTRAAAGSLRVSYESAGQLGQSEPVWFAFQGGDQFDLYTANIGRHYLLLLIFRVEARRARIGTVWIFTQRAIKDLLILLPEPDDKVEMPATQAVKPLATLVSEKPEAKSPEADMGELAAALDAAGGGIENDVDAFWEDALRGSGEGDGTGLSYDEARKKGILPPEFDSPDESA